MQRRSSACIAAVFFLLCALAGCSEKTVYCSYVHSPVGGWEKTDSLVFAIPPLEKEGNHQLSLHLRTDNSYPFRSLVLIVDQLVLPAGTFRADTLNCLLANDRGKVLGKGINIYQYEFGISNQRYECGDSLRITVHHDMKREILPGIADLGIVLSTSDD